MTRPWKKSEPKSRKRPLLLAAVLVPVIAGLVWAARSLRPSAAGDEVATPEPATAGKAGGTSSANTSTANGATPKVKATS
jgi:hypothetical protein